MYTDTHSHTKQQTWMWMDVKERAQNRGGDDRPRDALVVSVSGLCLACVGVWCSTRELQCHSTRGRREREAQKSRNAMFCGVWHRAAHALPVLYRE